MFQLMRQVRVAPLSYIIISLPVLLHPGVVRCYRYSSILVPHLQHLVLDKSGL